MIGAGGGIRTSKIGPMMAVSRQWRCFSAANLSFFFFKNYRSIASLAGAEKHELQAHQLSSLRQDIARGFSKRCSQEEGQMPNVRQYEKLESWKNDFAQISRRSAVLLQRLRRSIYGALSYHVVFFFFKEASE